MAKHAYRWWEDPRHGARLDVEGLLMSERYPEAAWVVNERGNYAARVQVRGRRVDYVVECEYPPNFPHGQIVGRILDPDISDLDSYRDHVLHPNIVCVHRSGKGGELSGVVAMRWACEWIATFGERHFG